MLYAEIRHDVCCFFGSNCWESSGIHWEGSFFLFCWGNILRDRFFSSTTCHDTKSLTIWFVWTLISCQALEFGLIDGVLETEYWMAMGKKMDMNSTPKATDLHVEFKFPAKQIEDVKYLCMLFCIKMYLFDHTKPWDAFWCNDLHFNNPPWPLPR